MGKITHHCNGSRADENGMPSGLLPITTEGACNSAEYRGTVSDEASCTVMSHLVCVTGAEKCSGISVVGKAVNSIVPIFDPKTIKITANGNEAAI